MNVISVICPPDQQLHLATYERGLGASVFTLCLERWTDREPCRKGSKLCPVCVGKWKQEQDAQQRAEATIALREVWRDKA